MRVFAFVLILISGLAQGNLDSLNETNYNLLIRESDERLFLALKDYGINETLAASAIIFRRRNYSQFKQRKYFVIVDMSIPSIEERFFVIDAENQQVYVKYHVSHGEGSDIDDDGNADLDDFSNIPGSHQSSLGAYKTGEPYFSYKWRVRALRLDGLSRGLNTNARARAIVLHEEEYATEEYRKEFMKMGTSEGCLVLDPVVSQDFIDMVVKDEDTTDLGVRYPSLIFVGFGDRSDRYLTSFQQSNYRRTINYLLDLP